MLLGDLQTQVQTQCESLIDLEKNVSQTRTDVEEQHKLYEHLSDSVEHHRGELQRALEEYDKRLSKQEKLIRDQNDVLKKLLKFRFKLDFAVDIGIFAFAYSIAGSRFVGWPAGLLAAIVFPQGVFKTAASLSAIDRSRRQQKLQLFMLFCRLTVFLGIFKQFRYVAIRNGFHNMVGSASAYLAFFKDQGNSMMNLLGFQELATTTPSSPPDQLSASGQATPGQQPSNTFESLYNKLRATFDGFRR